MTNGPMIEGPMIENPAHGDPGADAMAAMPPEAAQQAHHLRRPGFRTVMSGLLLAGISATTASCGIIGGGSDHEGNGTSGSGSIVFGRGHEKPSEKPAASPSHTAAARKLLTLKAGTKNKHCVTLQYNLDHNEREDYFSPPSPGYLPICGPVTTKGLKQWQKDSGYVPDGKIEVKGPLWKKLAHEATLTDNQVNVREERVAAHKAAAKAAQEREEAEKEARRQKREARRQAREEARQERKEAREEARQEREQKAADEAVEQQAEDIAQTLPAGISIQAIEHAIQDGTSLDSNKDDHMARILSYDETTDTMSVPLSVGAQFGDDRPPDADNPDGFATPEGEWQFQYRDQAGAKAISHEVKIPGTNKWAHMPWAHYYLPGIATHYGDATPSHGCEHIYTMEGAEMIYKLPDGTYNVVHDNDPEWHVTLGTTSSETQPPVKEEKDTNKLSWSQPSASPTPTPSTAQ